MPGLDSPDGNKAMGDGHLEIHRLKARLPLTNGDVKIVQGVREVFEILGSGGVTSGTILPSEGKIVFIGRHLDDHEFGESFFNTINSC